MTLRGWTAGLAFFFLAALLAAQTGPEVEASGEPSHHLVLQNNYVRVFYVDLPRGSTTLTHRHGHDYIAVTLGAAEISNEVTGKSPVQIKLQDSETVFMSGGFTHRLRDLGNTPFRNVTVELLQDEKARKSPPREWEDERGLQVLEGGTQDVLFVKDGVRVSEVDLQPGGMLPAVKKAAPRLLVAVSDVELRSHGSKSSEKHLRVGEVAWMAGGAEPVLMNVGKNAEKFILMEFH